MKRSQRPIEGALFYQLERDESDSPHRATPVAHSRLSGREKEEENMKTMCVYRLTNLSPTLFHRLKAAQMEAAQVWNVCVDAHKQARMSHARWLLCTP